MNARAQLDTSHTGWGPSGLTPAASICVFGMRRSGNHAVINWLLRNPPANSTGTVFLNNCRLGRDPFKSHKSLEVNGKRRGEKIETVSKAGKSPVLVISFEDTPPPEPGSTRSVMHDADMVTDHQIIVFRSFLNWSASLLKKLRGHPSYTSVTRHRILQRAFECYGQMLRRLAQKDVVGVCYDAWALSPSYRSDLLGQLGLPETDNALGNMQRYGGGSSFQDDILNGQSLGPHQRWVQMVEDSEYLVALWVAAQDPELMQTVKDLFPDDIDLLQPLIGAKPGLGNDP
jgi:hypothetical protein